MQVHLLSFVYWYSRQISPVRLEISLGGRSAKVCLSAKFFVPAFKVSILYSFGGSICQSMFICQVLCTGIQGISALFIGGVYLPKYVHLPSFVYWYSRQISAVRLEISLGGPSAKVCLSAKFLYQYSRNLCSIHLGVYLPKYVHLPSFLHWYSRQILSVRVKISYFIWGVFGGVSRVLQVSRGCYICHDSTMLTDSLLP